MNVKKLNILGNICTGLLVLWLLFLGYWFVVPEPIIPRGGIAWKMFFIAGIAFGIWGHWLYREYRRLQKPDIKIRKLTLAERILEIITVIWGLFIVVYYLFIPKIIIPWWGSRIEILTPVISSVIILLWVWIGYRAKRRGEI